MGPVFEVARSWYAPDLSGVELAEATQRILDSGALPTGPYDGSRLALAALKDMTSRFIGHFVARVEEATLAAYGPGPHTRYDAELVIPSLVRAECVVLKALAAHFVMSTPQRRQVLAGQTAVIEALSAAYLESPEQRLDPIFQGDLAAAPDDAARLRVIADQIASLSDGRAWTLHATWGDGRA